MSENNDNKQPEPLRRIFFKKAVIMGNIFIAPGTEKRVPEDITQEMAQAQIDAGHAVDVRVKAPEKTEEKKISEAIEAAKDPNQVNAILAQVEKPTKHLLDTASGKIKSFAYVARKKQPGALK